MTDTNEEFKVSQTKAFGHNWTFYERFIGGHRYVLTFADGEIVYREGGDAVWADIVRAKMVVAS